MIRKYPGQNEPSDPPAASSVPRLQSIQVNATTLSVETSPAGTNSPVSSDTYYHVKYIDDQLNAIKARLTALETRATSLEGRATVVERRATTLETGLATTNTKVGVIEGIVNPPVITSSGSNYKKTTGSNFTYQIAASNTPTSYGASGLPSGLSVNSAGYISGTITAGPGPYPVTVSATNIGGTGTRSFTITVT